MDVRPAEAGDTAHLSKVSSSTSRPRLAGPASRPPWSPMPRLGYSRVASPQPGSPVHSGMSEPHDFMRSADGAGQGPW
jgi:hypothetical protein